MLFILHFLGFFPSILFYFILNMLACHLAGPAAPLGLLRYEEVI